MRKTLLILILALLGGFSAWAAGRIYVSTDKSVYVAGDWLWCSLFNIDTASGKLSDMSAVAYLEAMIPEFTTDSRHPAPRFHPGDG